MRILFVTNFPAPYRVDFFNELGKYCDLTVAYELSYAAHRDKKWVGNPAEHFKEIYLEQKKMGTSRSWGWGVLKLVASDRFDAVVFCGYASPSIIIAIEYCQFAKKKYYLEFDGGFFPEEFGIKYALKKQLVRPAAGVFITCKEAADFLTRLGVPASRQLMYPFSSMHSSEILDAPFTAEAKRLQKEKMGIREDKALLSIGRFIPGKGFDELLTALIPLARDFGVYIIGGDAPQEYMDICHENHLDNVHFLPFCCRDELFEWYKACDLFVFPTRKDIWGLVVHEAMSFGLPVISSDMCIAARALVRQGENGVLYTSGHCNELTACIQKWMAEDTTTCACYSLDVARKYTIETMTQAHIDVWGIPHSE